jgi:hypothetical protein
LLKWIEMQYRLNKACFPFQGPKFFFLLHGQTHWYEVFHELVYGFQLVRELPAFMEPKGSSPYCEHLLLDPFLGQLRPVHTFTDHFSKIFV